MQLITPTMQVVTNLWQNGENYATIHPTNGGAPDPAPPGLVPVYPSNKVRCTIMKVKKLLALVLSAMMAVSMLTACGGGGSSSLNVGEVSSLLNNEGYDVTVRSSTDLKQASSQVAEYLQSKNDFSTETANAYLTSFKEYPIISGNQARIGMGASISSAELGNVPIENMVAAVIATLDVSMEQAGYGAYVAGYYVGMTEVTAQNGIVYYVLVIEAEISQTPQ